MATKLKPVDIAIVGFGWTGAIMATELGKTGLKIVAFERGGPRSTDPDFLEPRKDDELRYFVHTDLMQNTQRDTLTFRNNAAQTALPMRRLGSFLPGEGVGGSGVHWGGMAWRWLEWDHAPHSMTVDRYGAKIIPDDMNLADWGVSYADLEPYYEKFERASACSGRAGNLDGRKMPGGNPFEGPRKSDYPNPPLKYPQPLVMFEKAAADLGYHPFPTPAGIASRPYTNPDGVEFGACHYCGFCDRFGCEVNAKASAHFALAPLAMKNPDFELRTHARVLKVNLDAAGKRAVSVTYIDARGREFEQPADLVILSAFGLGNVHLALLSGIGKPYDPIANTGVVGRNYAYQGGGGAILYFGSDSYMHPYMAAGANSVSIDDFNGGNFDFEKAGFIGGGLVFAPQSGGKPIGYHPTPHGTPRWGSAWKKAVVDNYERAAAVVSMGSVMSYRQNYLDLDPTYRDPFGRPLMRMTFDFQPNEIRQMNHQADVCVSIGKAMGAKQINRILPPIPYSIVPYQSTHNTGGTIMGTDPGTSVVNRFQQVWDVPNVFVTGASVLPQNAGKNPTGPVASLAYLAADSVKQYLKSPGALVHS